MWIYYTIFFLIAVFYFQTQYNPPDKKYLTYIMLALGIFVGLGDMLGGYDRYVYADLFDDVANYTMAGKSYTEAAIMGYKSEFGYVYLNVALSYITANRYIFIFIYTVILYVLILQSFKRYITNYPFALLLFLGLWFFFTFTYLRQVMAVSIAWLGYRYIYERKPWKYLLVVVLAYSFHNSAIIFAPLYFLPLKKFNVSLVIMVMVALLLIGITGAPSALFDNFGEATGSTNRTTAYAQEEFGVKMDYIYEAALFLYVILSSYKKIPETKFHLCFLNISLAFCGTLLFFVKSSNAGRLSWYFIFGLICILSMIEIKSKIKKDFYVIIVLMFFLVNRIVTSWGIMLSPYKTFLTEGIREGDPIHEEFEYDERYDKDKFYRPPFLWFGKSGDDSNTGVQ